MAFGLVRRCIGPYAIRAIHPTTRECLTQLPTRAWYSDDAIDREDQITLVQKPDRASPILVIKLRLNCSVPLFVKIPLS